MAFVGAGFIDKSEAPKILDVQKTGYLGIGPKEYGGYVGQELDYVTSVNSMEAKNYYFFDQNKTSLNDGEILIDINFAGWLPESLQISEYEILESYASQNIDSAILNGFDVEHWAEEYDYYYVPVLFKDKLINPQKNVLPITELKLVKKAPQTLEVEITPEEEKERAVEIFAEYLIRDGYHDNTYTDKTGVDIIKQKYIDVLSVGYPLINPALQDFCITMRSNDGAYNSLANDINVVGVTFFDQEMVTVSENIYSAYKNSYNARYSYAIAQMPTDKKAVKELVKYSYEQKDDTVGYSLTNTATETVENIGVYIANIAEGFIYIGIGFAVFAIVMFLNFLLSAIKDSVSEIGILRALGARSKDIMLIFIIQSLVIAVVNFVIAVVLTAVLASVADGLLQESFTIYVKALEFSIRQVGVLMAVSLGVSLIGAVLPVAKVLRQEPVDVIRT